MKENILSSPYIEEKYSARYIKLDVFTGAYYPIINELQVLTTKNSNLSIRPNTIATASSYHLQETQAFHAIDNDTVSLWHKNVNDASPWFQLDFGEIVRFSSIKTYTSNTTSTYFFTGCNIWLGNTLSTMGLIKQMAGRTHVNGWSTILD